MSPALPVLYERNVRSALPHVTIARRGCLLLCVGRSEAVRARVEDSLALRLGQDKVLIRGSLAEKRSDLWQVLVDARDASGVKPEDTVLSYRLGGQPELERERLFGLNAGRETRALERLRLLLWLDGFEQLEALRDKAPDLWAVRTDVQFYVSREDFEVPEEARQKVKGLDDEIREIDERLQQPWIEFETRLLLLIAKSFRMSEQGRNDEALRLLDEVDLLHASPEEEGAALDAKIRARALALRCAVLEALGRSSEARRLAAEAIRDAHQNHDVRLGWYAGSRLAVAFRRAEAYGAALATFREQDRVYEGLFARGWRVHPGKGPMFAHRARVWLEVGALSRAEADADTADHEIEPLGEEDCFRWVGLSVGESLRADIWHKHGRPIEGLTCAHRSCESAMGAQAWRRIHDTLPMIASVYRRMGLIDEARATADKALRRLRHEGTPLERANMQVWFGDLARDTGDLAEAQQRYALAIETLQVRATDPEQAARAAIEEAKVHKKWADIAPPQAATHHRDEARRLLEDVLQQPVSIDRHMEAHLALGKLHRACARFDDSAASLATYRDWARADQGPARMARASIELARTSVARGDALGAIDHLAAARADLEREEPLHRSRFVQKEILVVLHEAHVALGDLAAARADLTEALAVVRAEGLRLEELSAIQLLAELVPAPDTVDHRLPAAREAAAIAREVLWPAEEARALAVLASLELSAGHHDEARAAMEEATWIAASVGPPKVREELRTLAEQLA